MTIETKQPQFSVRWRDAFKVGIDQVDKEHQHLFNLVGKLHGETVMDVLDELLDYVSQHFQHEEELMKLASYPDFAEHVAQHEALTNSVAEFISGTTNWDEERVRELRVFATKWLVGHILNSDLKFGRWFRDNPVEVMLDSESHFHKIEQKKVRWFDRFLGSASRG